VEADFDVLVTKKEAMYSVDLILKVVKGDLSHEMLRDDAGHDESHVWRFVRRQFDQRPQEVDRKQVCGHLDHQTFTYHRKSFVVSSRFRPFVSVL